MSDLTYEELRSSTYTNPVTSFENQSVVFVFDNGLPPIACTLGFLFKATTKKIVMQIQNYNVSKITTNVGVDGTYSESYNFIYYNIIHNLEFKYGLKGEYYKNKYGTWIDMTAIRKQFQGTSNIFNNMYVGYTINEETELNSLYCRIADNYLFNNPDSSSLYYNYVVSDLSVLPASEYYTDDGIVLTIGEKDGSATYEKYDEKVIEKDGLRLEDDLEADIPINSATSSLSSDRVTFTTKLCNYDTGDVGSGDYKENDHHKYDDLRLEFKSKDANSTAYTDLDNLLIIVNGMLVNYVRDTTVTNILYLPNVVRFAGLQWTGIKTGYVPSTYLTTVSVGNEDTIFYDIPQEAKGYSYDFDIRIYKWNNISVSKFIEPINTITTLKTESYTSNTYWLTKGLIFSSDLEEGKFILLCNNEIVPKSEYYIDSRNPKLIDLSMVSSEFDILYSEIYNKLNLYLYQTLNRESDDVPQISDYVTDYSDTTITNKQFQAYIDAMDAYYAEVSSNGTFADLHTPMSALFSVSEEFRGRTYSILKFDTIEETNYAVKVIENRNDIKVNFPYKDKITNDNWDINDIIVANGLIHRFENEYEDVFKVPTTRYLPDSTDSLYGADVYKLQVVKI